MTKTDNYTKMAHYYRGKLISEFARLEKTIDFFLAEYIIEESVNYEPIYTLILDRLTFEGKRTAFKAILDRLSIKKGFVKTKNNSYPSSDLIGELRLLNDERNKFAHYILVVQDDSNIQNSVINLVEYRDSRKILSYSKEDLDIIIKRIHIAHEKVNNLSIL